MPTTRLLPPMPQLLLASAGTLARRDKAGLAAALPAEVYQVADLPERFLEGYRAFFGGFSSPLPLPLLYVVAQRAQLSRMLRPDFPYALPGLLHLSNAQRLVAPLDPTRPFELEASVRPIAGPQPHWACVSCDVDIHQDGELKSTCQSGYLARRHRPASGQAERSSSKPAAEHTGSDGPQDALPEGPEGLEVLKGPEATEESYEDWRLLADEGRRYAALSGDFNPVHLAGWSARFFGFRRPILHGMNAVGRVAAHVERQTGSPVTALEVSFKRAIALPGEVRLQAVQTSTSEGWFEVRPGQGGPVHLQGSFTLSRP